MKSSLHIVSGIQDMRDSHWLDLAFQSNRKKLSTSFDVEMANLPCLGYDSITLNEIAIIATITPIGPEFHIDSFLASIEISRENRG